MARSIGSHAFKGGLSNFKGVSDKVNGSTFSSVPINFRDNATLSTMHSLVLRLLPSSYVTKN